MCAVDHRPPVIGFMQKSLVVVALGGEPLRRATSIPVRFVVLGKSVYYQIWCKYSLCEICCSQAGSIQSENKHTQTEVKT